jgi:hypothetical protein
MRKLFGKPQEVFPVKAIRAVRMMFITDEVQRVQITMDLENGEKVSVDMTPRLAYKLIVELESAYATIHPQIPRYNPNSPQF